jgi:spoIIIJ-associated protein
MLKKIDPAAPRINVDVAGYRAARRTQLEDRAREIATKVRESGREEAFNPMSPAERRIVHMTLQGMDGITTESRGDGRARHIVVMPAE